MLSQHTLLHCTMCVYIRLCLITLPPFYIAFTRYAVTLYIACTLDYASLHCCLFYTAAQIYFVTLYTVCIHCFMLCYTAHCMYTLDYASLHCCIFILLPQHTLYTVCTLDFASLHFHLLYCCHNIHCCIVHCVYTLDYALLHDHLFCTAATTYKFLTSYLYGTTALDGMLNHEHSSAKI